MPRISYEFALINELKYYMPGLPPEVTLQNRTTKKNQNTLSDQQLMANNRQQFRLRKAGGP